jgi:hypothetical protein
VLKQPTAVDPLIVGTSNGPITMKLTMIRSPNNERLEIGPTVPRAYRFAVPMTSMGTLRQPTLTFATAISLGVCEERATAHAGDQGKQHLHPQMPCLRPRLASNRALAEQLRPPIAFSYWRRSCVF